MSAITDCSKIADHAGLERCVSKNLIREGKYSGQAQRFAERLKAFKTFACGSIGNCIHSEGVDGCIPHQIYTAEEMFIFKSDFGREWPSVKRLVSNLCGSQAGT